jgi:bifunctional non-homologous end joining protein LigD
MARDPFLPPFIKPMLAVRGEPFDDDDFLFEINWDGIRMLAFIDADGYRLMNRHGVDVTARYPEFDFLAGLSPGTVFDGEMVVFSNGKPDFGLVQSRDKIRAPLKIRTMSRAQPATFVAFDLLYENHAPLLKQPLLERRGRLEFLVERFHQAHLVFSHGILGHGRALFAEACSQNLEGIVAKRARSRYRPGKRSDDWIKIKRHNI